MADEIMKRHNAEKYGELCSILCASGEWHTWTWDRKKWEPPPHRYTFLEVEEMMENDYAKHLSTMPSARFMQIVDMMRLLNGELDHEM